MSVAPHITQKGVLLELETQTSKVLHPSAFDPAKHIPWWIIALALLYTCFTLKIHWTVRLDQSAFWSAGLPGALLLAAAAETEPTQESLWGGSGDPSLGDGHTTKKGFTKASNSEWEGTYSARQTEGNARRSKTGRSWETVSWGTVVGRLKEEGWWTTACHTTALASRVLSKEKGWHQLHEPSNSFTCAGGVRYVYLYPLCWTSQGR